MRACSLSPEQVACYHRDGYLLVPAIFDADEIGLLLRTARQERALGEHAFGKDDGEGGRVRLLLWNHPGEGIYGMFARCRRIVEASEQILDDEVYHYHSKIIMKDAKIGGAWSWHQDYGFWYQNGVLFPDLVSVFIAVDPSTKENGCLQVIERSHLLGRIEHVLTGQQAGADRQRVAEILKRLPLLHVEMNPGAALFYHPNLLHRSDRNTSDKPRWSMICCYNARHSDPYKEAHHPRYTPLSKVDDRMIHEVGMKRFADDKSHVAWRDPETGVSARSPAVKAGDAAEA
jgi:ectoine hydroxylase